MRKHHAGACFFTVYCTSSVQYSTSVLSVHTIVQYTAQCTFTLRQSVHPRAQLNVQSSVQSVYGIHPSVQCTVQCTLTVWYSVHPSIQSSVQVYIYAQSTVQSAFQCTAEVQLEYIWSTSSIQSSAHLDASGVPSRGPSQGTQCGVKSVHVQCTCQCNSLMNSPVYTSVHLVYIHIQPGVQCTLQCTVCTCLFTFIKSYEQLLVILTRNGKEQIMNRFKEGRKKGTKFKQTGNWIA